jgi:RNA polymerase sigma-70 factor, ECF subfamily
MAPPAPDPDRYCPLSDAPTRTTTPKPGDDPHQAVAQLLETHGGRIYRLALRMTNNPEDAQDIVQDTFLQALRGWPGFEGRAEPSTWLHAIAANACRRLRKRRQRHPDAFPDLDELNPIADERLSTLVDEHHPVDEAVREETRQHVDQAIAQLPDDFRQALVLTDLVGFSVAEAAEVLDVKPNTIKTRVHRARLRLRQIIHETLPQQHERAPAPAYSRQLCLDLLNAKQDALDRGVPFNHEVICDRCRSVFAELDLGRSLCRDLAAGPLPPDLHQRVRVALGA